ncbi:MAG: class I SAM-dependent RNA methyltransferase [Syntrophaceae bacterium]|nr:class I SAM-dependent RNA methyltransferase [Syntrophaceae bacterium]
MRVGERMVAKIRDVAFGGDGVARLGNWVLFVPFTCDGDEVEVVLTEARKRYGRGRLLTIRTSGDQRVEPACPYVGRCGGCRLQHIAYPYQLVLKGRQLREIYARIAGLGSLEIPEVIPSPAPFAYRGKAEFHIQTVPGGPRRIGLMALASHDLVEVETCAIVAPSINVKLQEYRAALAAGRPRLLANRLVLWSDTGPAASSQEGCGGPAGEITRMVRGQRFTVPRRGFFQANEALVGELVGQVLTMAALSGRETVVDAYGGCGLFSLFLGPGARQLIGIEMDREAVRCARMNLARAGLSEARFLQGDVVEVLAGVEGRAVQRAEVVMLDPPREGCGESVLTAVTALKPERIVYVSCNPATQARDTIRLAALGYAHERLQALDMFPQTAHLEAVALYTPQDRHY